MTPWRKKARTVQTAATAASQIVSDFMKLTKKWGKYLALFNVNWVGFEPTKRFSLTI